MAENDNLFDDGHPITMQPVQGEAEAGVEVSEGENTESTEAKATTRKKRVAKKARAKKKPTPTVSGIPLGIFKIHPDAHDIQWGTQGAACFDVRAYLKPGTNVVVFNDNNKQSERPTRKVREQDAIVLNPGDRAVIPTGLIFDIPEGYSLRVHPRSGFAIKQGFTLANAEGVIDWDYTNELFIAIHNATSTRQPIFDGERIAQAELVVAITSNMVALRNMRKAPGQKTDRIGGMGSTGKS